MCRRAVDGRSCSLFYPPLTTCGDGEHQHDAAAYRRRSDITSPEYLHELDPQLQIALIVADHGTTTEQQRTRMANVDICSGSQSQRRGNLLLNLETMCFDQRTQVMATGGQLLTNVFIGASVGTIYDVVRSALHSSRITMSRVSTITLSSDCATNCTSAASDHRDDSGRPLPGSDGDTARSADKIAINTLKFVHHARAERDYLLSTMGWWRPLVARWCPAQRRTANTGGSSRCRPAAASLSHGEVTSRGSSSCSWLDTWRRGSVRFWAWGAPVWAEARRIWRD